jgi:putative membrane protein
MTVLQSASAIMLRDGFLGYRTSFMLDFVVVALVLVVPILLFSLYAVKVRRQYALHRNLQLLLGVVLLIAVGAFEVDLHLVQGGWENVVAKQQPALTTERVAHVRALLRIHLIFATTTPLLWIVTIALALRRFPNPPQPGPHSRLHKILGWLSTIDLSLTSVTGLIFYYGAFVAAR